MSGPIITSSANHISLGLGQARLTDMTIGGCGHTGTIVSGAPTCVTNSLPKARIGEMVTGCNIGNVVTGNTTHEVGNSSTCGATVTPLVFSTVVKGTPVTYTEVDFGNQDDDPTTDDGLNIYPPVVGRSPSPSEIQRSADLDVSPTTTHVVDSTSGIDTTTPIVSCLSAPEPAPDSFQLSANFTLGDLSSQALLSRTAVRAQMGLTYQEIVCNLQGLAENILEALVSQYGNIQVITSGFRAGTSTSQHNKGQASDIQYLNYSNQQVFQVSQFIKDNLNYDQLILEYGGNKPWIHVSFNRAGNRSISASNKFGTRVSPGNYQWGDLLYMT
jgi:uncharacterized Zn-binding protein involved in type VI secretion